MTKPTRHLLAATWGAVAFSMPMATANAAEQARTPNVLLIVSDDQGYSEFGFMGNPLIKTPHLDALAEQSAVYRNFIVGPVCSPSRTMLMMGRNHLKTGVWGNGVNANILDDEVFMPQFFQRAGYATALFGKHDSVQRREDRPWRIGIDYLKTIAGGYTQKDPLIARVGDGANVVKGWTADIITDEAVGFARESKEAGKPWWIDLSYIIPHTPWKAPDKYKRFYLDKGYSKELAECWGSITHMDECIGRMLKAVDELGEADNTIVLFLSDNGVEYGYYAKGKPIPARGAGGMPRQDWPKRNYIKLRGKKGDVYEGGIRSPLLVRWPGRIPSGPRKQYACVEDILPTTLALTGVDDQIIPEHLPFDGMSLERSLFNPTARDVDRKILRADVGPNGLQSKRWLIDDPTAIPMSEVQMALRGPRFKLYNDYKGNTFLYDLENDLGETTDVSGEFPGIAAEYKAELAKRFKAMTHSGRLYRMPAMAVGEHLPRLNVLSALAAQSRRGSVKAGDKRRYVHGFDAPGDSLTYRAKVLADGEYDILLQRTDLAQTPEFFLEFDGRRLKPVKVSDKELKFPPVSLKKGNFHDFSVGVAGKPRQPDSPEGRLGTIRFHKR